MRKLIMPILAVPMLILAIVAMSPLSVFAAAKHHTPHFYQKGNARSLGSNLRYFGGPVMYGTANVYAICREPTGRVQSNYNSLIQRYFGDVNGSGLYHNNTQYHDSASRYPSAEHLSASWVDTSAYPRSPLLDSDMQNEVSHAQRAKGWSSSIHNIFFVFLQANENLCFDNTYTQCASNYFCAYHNYFGSNTLYAAMPYAASFSCNPGTSPNHNDADQTINVTSHEQMEAATDPLLNAWYDSLGNEIGDKCAWMGFLSLLSWQLPAATFFLLRSFSLAYIQLPFSYILCTCENHLLILRRRWPLFGSSDSLHKEKSLCFLARKVSLKCILATLLVLYLLIQGRNAACSRLRCASSALREASYASRQQG